MLHELLVLWQASFFHRGAASLPFSSINNTFWCIFFFFFADSLFSEAPFFARRFSRLSLRLDRTPRTLPSLKGVKGPALPLDRIGRSCFLPSFFVFEPACENSVLVLRFPSPRLASMWRQDSLFRVPAQTFPQDLPGQPPVLFPPLTLQSSLSNPQLLSFSAADSSPPVSSSPQISRDLPFLCLSASKVRLFSCGK